LNPEGGIFIGVEGLKKSSAQSFPYAASKHIKEQTTVEMLPGASIKITKDFA
jgi:hypothetical protein